MGSKDTLANGAPVIGLMFTILIDLFTPIISVCAASFSLLSARRAVIKKPFNQIHDNQVRFRVLACSFLVNDGGRNRNQKSIIGEHEFLYEHESTGPSHLRLFIIINGLS